MTVQSSDAVKALLIRPTSFDKAGAGASKAPIEAFASSAAGATPAVQWLGQSVSGGERPDLTSAKVVVSGGKGLKSAENFKILNELADAIGGAAVGASRAAVDAGFAPNDLQSTILFGAYAFGHTADPSFLCVRVCVGEQLGKRARLLLLTSTSLSASLARFSTSRA